MVHMNILFVTVFWTLIGFDLFLGLIYPGLCLTYGEAPKSYRGLRSFVNNYDPCHYHITVHALPGIRVAVDRAVKNASNWI